MTPKKQWIWFHKPLFLSILLFSTQYVRKISVTSRQPRYFPIFCRLSGRLLQSSRKALVWQRLQKRFLVLLETMTTLNFDEDEVDLESNTEVPFSIIE